MKLIVVSIVFATHQNCWKVLNANNLLTLTKRIVTSEAYATLSQIDILVRGCGCWAAHSFQLTRLVPKMACHVIVYSWTLFIWASVNRQPNKLTITYSSSVYIKINILIVSTFGRCHFVADESKNVEHYIYWTRFAILALSFVAINLFRRRPSSWYIIYYINTIYTYNLCNG